jgi:high-affinity nickel-transport protein
MWNAQSLSFLGFLLGIRHALDADHVTAVAAILARQPSVRRALRVGVWWGVGHTCTILLVGGTIAAFRIVVSPRVGLALEFGVALMLIVLGFWNLRRMRQLGAPQVPTSGARPLVVGMVHGLAGSAAIALLVLATVSDPRWALGYLALFGIGTVAGMVLVTTALAVPATLATRRYGSAHRWLAVGSGVLSIALGVWIAAELSGPNGLFSATPRWTPH